HGEGVPVTHGDKPLRADSAGLLGQRLAALITLRDHARRVLQSQNEGWSEDHRVQALGSGHLCVRPPLPGPTLTQTWLERRPPDPPDAPIAAPASCANRSQGRQTAVARTKTN